MRAALVALRIHEDPGMNKRMICEFVSQAANHADLVLFPETATTGLVNNDDPRHDCPLAEPIPNRFLGDLGRLARAGSLHVGLGLLEREGQAIYDAFVLISDKGEIVLHYRRINPGWHGKNADPGVYRQGSEVMTYDHPRFGRMSVLLCGDLFEDVLVRRVRRKRLDLLLFPFGRAFADDSCDQERWDREELPQYVTQVKKAGALALMVNYIGPPELDDFSFGGAWAVDKDGEVLASLPLGREGILYCDLPDAENRKS